MYANIIVDISHEQLDKTFQYHVPDALLSQIDTGVMVNIPFGRGNRIITGYVIELTSKAEFDEERIKDIDSVVPNRVKAVEDMIKLAAWLKHNYGGTMNQALKTVIPVKEKIRQKEKKHIKLNVTKEEAKEFIKNAKRKSPSKEKLIEYLSDREEADMDVLKNETGISLSTIKSLENDGIIQIISRQLYMNPVKEDEILTGKQGE